MSEKNTLYRSIFSVLFAQLLLLLRGLLIMPVVIKTAGTAVFGAYVVLGSFITFIFAVSAFGTNYAYRRNLPSASSLLEQRALLIPQLIFRLAMTSLVCAAFLFFDRQIKPIENLIGVDFDCRLMCLWIFGLLANEQATDYYRYTNRIRAFNFVTVAPLYAFLGAFFLAVLADTKVDLDLLISFQAGTLLGISGLIFIYDILAKVGVVCPHTDWGKFFRDARVGLPIVWGFIFDFLLNTADRFFIVFFVSTAAVGEYQSAYQVAALLALYAQIIVLVLPAQLSRLVDHKKTDEAEYLVELCLHSFIMIALPFISGALLVGPTLVGLLSDLPAAQASRWVVPLIATSMAFYGIFLIFLQIGFVKGQNSRVQRANIFALAASLIINTSFLPFFPDIAVPGASKLIAYILSAWLVLRAVHSIWRIRFNRDKIYRYFAATGLMTIFLLLAGYRPGAVVEISALELIIEISAAAICYLISLALVGGLRKTEVIELIGIVKTRGALNKPGESG